MMDVQMIKTQTDVRDLMQHASVTNLSAEVGSIKNRIAVSTQTHSAVLSQVMRLQ